MPFYCRISQYNWRVRRWRIRGVLCQYNAQSTAVQGDTALPTFPPPTSSTLCLPGPSNVHELQRLKDEPQQKTLIEAPTTGQGGLRHGKNGVALQWTYHYVRQLQSLQMQESKGQGVQWKQEGTERESSWTLKTVAMSVLWPGLLYMTATQQRHYVQCLQFQSVQLQHLYCILLHHTSKKYIYTVSLLWLQASPYIV